MLPTQVVRICLGACLILAALLCVAVELESSLKEAYEGKVFMIRAFYSGNKLQYDSTGKLINYAVPGFWTLDGLAHVETVSFKGNALRLKCKRLVIAGSKADLDYTNSAKESKLEIEVAFPPNLPDQEEVKNLLSRIFVLDGAELPDLVPSYWKACVAAATSAVQKKGGPGCHFSSRLSEVIGLKPTSSDASSLPDMTSQETPSAAIAALPAGGGDSASAASLRDSRAQSTTDQLFRVGRGVSPPKAIYAPDPPYAEAARKSKFQGVCVLDLVVDSSGQPKNIQVQRPLGFGLDEQAVAAVATWKFEPAMKDAQPVPVRIAVEVSFHLY